MYFNFPFNTMKKIYFITLILFIIPANFSFGKVFNTRDKSLTAAFPKATNIEKIQVFLNDTQSEKIKQKAKTNIDSKLYTFYRATEGNREIGYAVIDTHTLRTTTETVLFVLNCDGSLKYTEILAFFEPQDYMPGNKWMNTFKNKSIKDKIKVGRDIPDITGATITSNSFSDATRKILAIYEVAVKEHH